MSDKDFKVKNKLVINGLTQTGPLVADANKQVDATPYLTTLQGGTGTTTAPSTGQVLYSSSGTTYAPTTLSSLDVKGATYSADAPTSPFVGQVWIESDSSSDSFDPNIIRRKSFTATAGQTTFTADLEFIQGYEQVFFNGMLLVRNNDYTTPTNTSVVLTTAAAAGDIVEIVSITNLNSINTATTTTNTFTGVQKFESNIGVGSVTSPSTLLHLEGTSAEGKDTTIVLKNTTASTGRDYRIISGDGGPFRIQDNTAGAERMRISSNGYVGIGTSSPAATLEVAGSVYFGTSNGSVAGAHSVLAKTNANWNYSGMNLVRVASNTTSPRFLGFPLDGDSLASTTIGGYNAIWGIYDSNPTAGSTSSALNSVMAYASYAGHRWYQNGLERMRIDSAGNVQISNQPVDTLRYFDIYNTNTGNNAGSIIRLITNNIANNGTTSVDIVKYRTGAFVIANNDGFTAFNTAGAERMRIDSGGRILVNTTTALNNEIVGIKNAGNTQTLWLDQTDANFSTVAQAIRTTRTNNTAYIYFVTYSNNGSDMEHYLRGDGAAFADGAWNGGGADYAEYFEWADGNPSNEDRRGYSVSLINDQIKIAEEGENVIGIISGNPAIVGDHANSKWDAKYLKDDFGSYIRDENNDRIINPDYDDTQEYVSREDRPEWAIVGLMGKLRLRKGQVTSAGWIKMRDISETVEEWLVR